MKSISAYIPVLHRGYRDFFISEKADSLFLFGKEIIKEFDYLRKDMRALDPEEVRSAIMGWNIFKTIEILEPTKIPNLKELEIVMPDEEESRVIAQKYFSGAIISYKNIFLRWDSKKVLEEKDVMSERTVSMDGLVKEMMEKANHESHKASNLWRRVGAVAARGGEVLVSGFNKQVPSQHTPYYEGDARMFFKKGLHIELTTDQHAESVIISEAAKRGIALEGADLYMSTFPCPPCAKIVAAAGIKRCYFSSGYSVLDGERILKDAGVEIIQVL